MIDDGLILDDGRTRYESWDWIWYSEVKIFGDFYTLEIKIPFKSIRYKKGITYWV